MATGIMISLAAAVMYAIRGFYTKKLLKNTDVLELNFISRNLSLIPFLIVVLIIDEPITITFSPNVAISFVVISVVGMIALLFSTKALEDMELGVYNTLTNMGVFFTALVSGLFLNEVPSIGESIIIILIMFACINIRSKSVNLFHALKIAFHSGGFKYLLIANTLFAFTSVCMRFWTQIDSPIIIAFVTSIGMAVFQSLIFIVKRDKSKKFSARRFLKKEYMVLAAATCFAYVLRLIAIKYTPAALSDVLLSLNLLGSILLGRVFLKERYSGSMYFKFFLIFALVATLPLV